MPSAAVLVIAAALIAPVIGTELELRDLANGQGDGVLVAWRKSEQLRYLSAARIRGDTIRL